MGARDAERPPAVLTAMNLNGLGVARALGRHGVPVIGIHAAADRGAGADAGRPPPELRSRYLREVWRREPGDDGLLDVLLERGASVAGRPVLIPITDESVRTIARNLDQLRGLYRIALPEPDLVEKLLSKKGIDEAVREVGLPAPRTWVVEDVDGIEVAAREARFPCVLKPQVKNDALFRAGARKADCFDGPDELLATYRIHAPVDPRAVVQEFVPGGDDQVYFCLSCYGQDHAPLGSFTGRKLRQWPPHCGGTSSCEPADFAELAELSTRFFRDLGMHGLCSVEFKRDPRDGVFYLIEPTIGRPDWQNAVADNNGVPLAYLGYCELAGDPIPASPSPGRRRSRWVHLEADRRSAAYYRRRRELGFWTWLWSLRPPVRGAFLCLDDPGPYLSILAAKVRRAVRRLARMLGRGGSSRSR